MKKLSIGVGAAALLLSVSTAFAAPCSTGSTKGKSPTEQTNAKSSDTDQSSKNIAGGQQPGSPGTVGAMNNVGANQQVGDKGNQKEGSDPGSKNLAGGQQPAAPGTVGAMNSTGAQQDVGTQASKGGDDC